MEVELGIKLTKRLEELASVDFRIAKDQAGPLFISKETETMFLLIVHLKGHKREQIKIEINVDGSRITISGKRPVQETKIVGWRVYKKEMEMRGFRRVFRIPNGVILDKINARFNEDESMLKVFMPKAMKGIRGDKIEEVKEDEMIRGNSGPQKVEADEKIAAETSQRRVVAGSHVKYEHKDAENLLERNGKGKIDMGIQEDEGVKHKNVLDGNVVEQNEEPGRVSAGKTPVVQECMSNDAIPRVENEMIREGLGETSGRESNLESVVSRSDHNESEQVVQARSDDESLTEGKKLSDQSTKTDAPTKSNMFCAPVIAGSALLVSLLVFVVQFIRTSNKPSDKKH